MGGTFFDGMAFHRRIEECSAGEFFEDILNSLPREKTNMQLDQNYQEITSCSRCLAGNEFNYLVDVLL